MKRIISMFVALAFVVGVSACGQKTPTWQEQYDLGIRYLDEGNYEEAIIAFTAAIEIDPKQAPAYVGRGDAYIGSGETEENLAAAQADYEQAIELDETKARAYLGLADVYIRMGEYDKALEILKNALEKTNSDQAIADKIAEMESGNIVDDDGHVRRVSYYDENNMLKWYYIYQYEEGHLSAIATYDHDGVQTSKLDILYDAFGNVVQWPGSYSTETGEIWLIYRYTYNQNNQKIMSERYDFDGTLVDYTNYFYENDLLICKKLYDEDGELEEQDTYEYDEMGNNVKINNFNKSGLMNYAVLEYDSNGRQISLKNYDPDGKPRNYEIISYDDQGNYSGHKEYDAEGNLIESTVHDR